MNSLFTSLTPLHLGPYRFQYPTLLRYVGMFASLYSTAFLIRHHVVDWTSSSGPSMYPTFSQERSIVVVSKLHAYGRGCRVGDLVQAKSPIIKGGRVGKRIIGMPGDYVVVDPHMANSVGGAEVEGVTDRKGKREEPDMVQVPEGHVWVAGDNMGWSRDSRFYGPLPMALIQGKFIAACDGWFSWTWIPDRQLQEVPVVEVDG